MNLQFNQFLVRDEQPLLFHTGMKGLFPVVRDAVATLLVPATIRRIGFSHFEADECGALMEWQTLAPAATAVCSLVAKLVSVDDVVARRPAQALADGEQLCTGKYRFRLLQTPHVPHCWEASLLFEETQGTLLCSDLFHQNGDVEPSTSADVVGRFKQMLVEYQQGPFAHYMPYTPYTEPTLQRLAGSSPAPWQRCTGRRSWAMVQSACRPRAGHARGPWGTLARWQRTSVEQCTGRIQK